MEYVSEGLQGVAIRYYLAAFIRSNNRGFKNFFFNVFYFYESVNKSNLKLKKRYNDLLRSIFSSKRVFIRDNGKYSIFILRIFHFYFSLEIIG